MTDLTRASAAELADLLARGETCPPVRSPQAHLERTDCRRRAVHAYLHVDAEGALAPADEVDRRRAAGEPFARARRCAGRGQGRRRARGPADDGRLPDPGGLGPALRRDRRHAAAAAGMPILGKTNMDEFAMGSSTENSAYGPTTTRGTSTASPAAPAAGSARPPWPPSRRPLAIGTDTGGSIRQPAAVTGTVGTKPTYGGVSRYGVIAWPPASTRPARAPARCWTRRCCTR
jgi:aspartyl-tRNA(Asn)/glutamyl-tRNA(Gln) amidotransferase subunit A